MARLTVNGRERTVEVDPATPLLHVLSDDLRLKGRSSAAVSANDGLTPAFAQRLPVGGFVTAYAGKCELGQGLFTAQVLLVAEELCAPPSRVRLIQCDTARTPDQGTTSGSQSHPANSNQRNLALAAATAREALVRLAATRLGLPAAQVTAEDG